MPKILTKRYFKPGATFMYNTGTGWLPITIHKNCAKQLIDFVKLEFLLNPGDFKIE